MGFEEIYQLDDHKHEDKQEADVKMESLETGDGVGDDQSTEGLGSDGRIGKVEAKSTRVLGRNSALGVAANTSNQPGDAIDLGKGS